MLNIPTELLRTLVTVVDQRSFTKTAQSLGVTQPAVSAQIKRLQFLLGYEVLDKSAPGVSLTRRGEMVVVHARRMLSINDQIVQLDGNQPKAQTVRVAIQGDFAGVRIPATLAQFRRRWPEIRFEASATNFESMFRGLRQGDLDLCVAFASSKSAIEAHHLWGDQAVWVQPGAEYNKGSYWRVYGSRSHYTVDGQDHSFPVSSLISWRGQWYVVHLGEIR